MVLSWSLLMCFSVCVCVFVTVTDTNPMLSPSSEGVLLCTRDETMSQAEFEKNNCTLLPGKNACTQKCSHVGVSHKTLLGGVAKGTILICETKVDTCPHGCLPSTLSQGLHSFYLQCFVVLKGHLRVVHMKPDVILTLYNITG